MDETQLVDSFLPVKLLTRIHGASSDQPIVEFQAAVLFVDVSRYTALIEQFARRGQGGLERVSKLLNLSYGRCADQVYDRGGEVLYFEGDSLVAYWPADGDHPGHAVRAATACAQAICNDAGQASAFETEPTMHVGVGAGKLWAAALGERSIANLFVGGDALNQAAMSQARARPREYVLSDEATLALTRDPVRGSSDAPDARPEYASTPPRRDWLMSFVPPLVRDVMRGQDFTTGSAENSTKRDGDQIHQLTAAIEEIRPVSAIFARISGLHLHDPSAFTRLHALCASLHNILQERGGPPGELYYDEKGLIFSGVFGSRGHFHRDDPLRAVDAALAIDQTVRAQQLSASIGLATGNALFSIVGSARRFQLMMHGAPVNRAARLMTAFATGIICDAPTERANRAAFDFEQQGTLQLDGLGDMAAVFRPLGPQPRVAASSTVTGRDKEMAVLRQTFGEAGNGGTRLLAVLGEPGIGKTALVTAFAKELQDSGVEVGVVRAEREDRRTSFLAWRRVLASLLGLPPDCDGFTALDEIRARVRAVPGVVARLPLLGGVLGIVIPESEGTRHLEGPHRGDATMRLLGDLVGVLAPRPLVLVMEDSQWLDSASWRLIEWILSSLPSLLIIACVRLEEIPEELKNLRRRAEHARLDSSRRDANDPARFCRILDLEELDETSIREIVARTLRGEPPHQELAASIAKMAGGNPFFAEEISITLKSEGLIAVRDGFWRPIRPLDKLRYFEGVERVIRERIDFLDSAAFMTLKAAAVIGRSFGLAALVELLGEELHREAIAGAIETLMTMHLVKREREDGDFEFRHDQTRDVVYSLISMDARKRLHGKMAQWIESNQSVTAMLDTAVLVQHFEAAADFERAVKYADMAIVRALEVGSFREVESFLEICFSHESRQQSRTAVQKLQAVRWRRQLAEAHYGRGDIHAQGVAVRRALKVAEQVVPESALRTVIRLVGRGLQLALQQVFPPSAKWQRADLRAWEKELARCFNQAATVDYFELRYSRGMCNLLGAVVHAERIGVSVELAVASSQLGCGLSFLGWQGACDYFIARAERVAITLADPAAHSHVCILDALWRIGRCDWPMVDRLLDKSQDLSTKAGDQLGWCNAQGMRFWSLYYRGDVGALEQAALALLSRAQNAGNIQQEIWALRCKALWVLHTDRPREAMDILRLITSAMHGSVDLAAQISAKGALALALARVGNHVESIEAVNETLNLLREQRRPTSHSTLVGITGVVEVLLRGREAGLSREYDQWPDWERQALTELHRYRRVFRLGDAQYGLWSGLSHWLNGQTDRALLVWNVAITTARELALRQDESMIAAEMRRRKR